MILIGSIQNDRSTNDVIDWLNYYKEEYIRVNPETKITDLRVGFNDNNELSVKIEDTLVDLKDVKSYWFRRGRFNLSEMVPDKGNMSESVKEGIYSHLINEELKTIEKYIVYVLEQKKKLGSYYTGNANKLKSLKIALEVGLTIPDTIVSTTKNILSDFFDKKNGIISKGVQDIMSFISSDKSFCYKTEEVTKDDIDEMNRSFFPSLLQSNIEKLYELRVFYMNGEFYSMAIFSQADEQTKVDFRNYNREKPNRNVPYKLPPDIENKLDLFMKKMNLDTGSIDIIVTPEFEYVFLEVNPVGQYGMTSIPCNYHLDERIAKYLSE